LAQFGNARVLDFSLEELKEVRKPFGRLTLPERGEAPCIHLIGLLEQKMEEIDAQIRHLQELRGDLGQLLAEGEQLPKDKEALRAMCLRPSVFVT